MKTDCKGERGGRVTRRGSRDVSSVFSFFREHLVLTTRVTTEKETRPEN